jgi:transposase-like protein
MINAVQIADQSDTRPTRHPVTPYMVKPYTVSELCKIYGVSARTFKKWLKPFQKNIGKRNGRYYSVLQVEIIISMLGLPHWLE